MQPLTPRQADLVTAVRRHWAEHAIPPSLAELAQALGLSTARACRLVHECEAKGAVARDPGKYRSIRATTRATRQRAGSA